MSEPDRESFPVRIMKLAPLPVRAFFKSPAIAFPILSIIAGILGNRADKVVEENASWLFHPTAIANWVWISWTFFVLSFGYFVYVAIVQDRQLQAALSEIETLSSTDRSKSSLKKTDEFYPELTKLVTKKQSELHVSIGEGDFVHGWLVRIFEDADSGRGLKPQIERIIVRCLSSDLCSELEQKNYIPAGFERRMKRNLSTLKKLAASRSIPLQIRSWNRLPPFHGFLYASRFMTNSWAVNGIGHLHVRTELFDQEAGLNPEHFKLLVKYFNDSSL